jgi:hypothetical protein
MGRQAARGRGLDAVDRGTAAGGTRRVEGGCAHGDHLDRVAALHGGQRVAGVDRAHEGVGRFDGDDVGHLRHIEQCRNARHEVLAEAAGRRHQVRVTGGERQHQRGDVFGQRMFELRRVGAQHLRDTADLRRCGDGRGAGVTGDQHGDGAADPGCGGDRVQRGRAQRRVVVLGNDQNVHVRFLSAGLWLRCEASHEFGHIGHLHPGLPLRRLAHAQRGQARRHVDVELGRRQRVERLLLRLHDVGQAGVARLVQAQVGADERRQRDADRFEAAVDLARDDRAPVGHLHLRRKGGLTPAEQRGQHLAGLVRVVVDGLLAADDELRLLALRHGGQQLGHGQRLQFDLGARPARRGRRRWPSPRAGCPDTTRRRTTPR